MLETIHSAFFQDLIPFIFHPAFSLFPRWKSLPTSLRANISHSPPSAPSFSPPFTAKLLKIFFMPCHQHPCHSRLMRAPPNLLSLMSWAFSNAFKISLFIKISAVSGQCSAHHHYLEFPPLSFFWGCPSRGPLPNI